MRPLVGTGKISWIRPLNSPPASSSDIRPPSARSRSTAAPDRRWPVAIGMARASTAMSAGAVATSVTLNEITLLGRCRQVLSDKLEHMRDTQLDAPPASGGRDVYQT